MAINKWFDALKVPTRSNSPSRLESAPMMWANVALNQLAFETGRKLEIFEGDGYLNSPFEDLLKSLLELSQAKLVSEKNANEDICYNISYSEGMLRITFEDKEEISFSCIFLDNELGLHKKIYELCNAAITQTSTKSLVSMLARTQDGIELISAGIGGVPIERGNYTEKVLVEFDKIVAELKDNEPSGRLTILYGSPGSGKTFFTRGIVDAVRDVKYIIIPPAMTAELMDPSIIPALIEQKRNYDGAIILLLEDADSCLVRRASDNMSGIASILNFSDGIIGSVLDVRIIATTNAKKLDIDEALRRPGRLCVETHIDALAANEASNVLRRLVPDSEYSFMKPVTLAQVYEKARELGWKPPQKTKKPEKSRKYHGYIQ